MRIKKFNEENSITETNKLLDLMKRYDDMNDEYSVSVFFYSDGSGNLTNIPDFYDSEDTTLEGEIIYEFNSIPELIEFLETLLKSRKYNL